MEWAIASSTCTIGNAYKLPQLRPNDISEKISINIDQIMTFAVHKCFYLPPSLLPRHNVMLFAILYLRKEVAHK